MKRLIALVVGLVLTASVLTSTALANGGDDIVMPPADTVYCLKGGTPDQATTGLGQLLDQQEGVLPTTIYYEDGSKTLTQGIAELAIQLPGSRSTLYLGYYQPLDKVLYFIPEPGYDSPEGLFDPGYWIYLVARGQCVQMSDRSFFLCYGAGPNSIEIVSRAVAQKKLDAGARVPVASKSQKTDFKVGNHFLTCAGGKPTGRFVSTGNGGEVVSVDSVGAGLVRSNPLDYTLEVE